MPCLIVRCACLKASTLQEFQHLAACEPRLQPQWSCMVHPKSFLSPQYCRVDACNKSKSNVIPWDCQKFLDCDGICAPETLLVLQAFNPRAKYEC